MHRAGRAVTSCLPAADGGLRGRRLDRAFERNGVAARVVDVADALKGRPALVGYLPAGQYPRDVAASPDGSTVLVANYDSGQLETVNVAALP
jgi:hypothetical protein